EMAKQKAIFLDGAEKLSHTREDADRIFELMAYFAGYGFNKSHSAAYALITYQTAYLKAHYPVEFVAATLSADKDKTEKVVRTVAEARSMGITVLPPDVNESEIDFTVVYDASLAGKVRRGKDKPVCLSGKVRDPMGPRIRFGLGGLRGVGDAALEAIFEERSGTADGTNHEQPFVDMFDFTSRVDLRRVNKNVVEALVQCGGFDAVHEKLSVDRASATAAIESAIERGKKLAHERASGQTNLFSLLGDADSETVKAMSHPGGNFPTVEPWDTRELLAREKQTLGFYVSGHPLDRYAKELKRFCNATTETLPMVKEGTEVTVGGSVEGYRERTTKTGRRIAFFSLEDPLGRVEVIVRPRNLDGEGVREVLQSGDPVVVTGNVQFEQDRGGGEDAQPEAKIVLTAVAPLAESLKKRTTSVRVSVAVDTVDKARLEALKETLQKHPGGCPVRVELFAPGNWRVALVQTRISVDPSDALMASLERLFGKKVAELR
ncbi:MAG: OB-fold nucleic acid binding domain-containing protein, partial [Myxococcota bacterium]